MQEEKKKKGGIIKKIVIVVLALGLLGAIFDGEDKNKNLEESVLNLTNEINNKTTEIERLNNVIADLQEKLKNYETKITEEQKQETKIEEDQESEEVSEIEEEKDETVKMTPEEIEEMSEEIVKKMSPDTKMSLFIASLKKHYEGFAKVNLDKENKIVQIIPEEDFKKIIEILFTFEFSEPIMREGWDKMVNDFKNISKKIGDEIDPDYALEILNPNNFDKSILIIKNGMILYNFADDFN